MVPQKGNVLDVHANAGLVGSPTSAKVRALPLDAQRVQPFESGTVPKPTAGAQCKILKTASRSNMPSVVVAFPRPFAFLSASRR